jgi:hypothetical protein
MEKTSSTESVPVFVGLDYHTKGVQVCVVDAQGRVRRNKRCGNSLLEIAEQIEPGWSVQRAAIESCCGAADLAEAIAAELRWPMQRGATDGERESPEVSAGWTGTGIGRSCHAGVRESSQPRGSHEWDGRASRGQGQ